jgi:hypothetical protein
MVAVTVAIPTLAPWVVWKQIGLVNITIKKIKTALSLSISFVYKLANFLDQAFSSGIGYVCVMHLTCPLAKLLKLNLLTRQKTIWSSLVCF